jgi:hypothetical protein
MPFFPSPPISHKLNHLHIQISPITISGVPRNFIQGGGSTNSVEDRENGDLGAVAPIVRGSGGSCNLVQEISFHIVKFS